MRLEVADRPGVLAQVSTVLASHDVSIEAVRQTPVARRRPTPTVARLVITTHAAPEHALRSTVEAIAGLDVVRRVVSVLRVEGA